MAAGGEPIDFALIIGIAVFLSFAGSKLQQWTGLGCGFNRSDLAGLVVLVKDAGAISAPTEHAEGGTNRGDGWFSPRVAHLLLIAAVSALKRPAGVPEALSVEPPSGKSGHTATRGRFINSHAAGRGSLSGLLGADFDRLVIINEEHHTDHAGDQRDRCTVLTLGYTRRPRKTLQPYVNEHGRRVGSAHQAGKRPYKLP